MAEFRAFPKITRLNQNWVITEKLDGTNACVVVDDALQVSAQSRTRVIAPGNDNYAFAAWVADNSAELAKLGPGYHFGEWWGMGIQRNYNLAERRFSLFNVGRWFDRHGTNDSLLPNNTAGIQYVPECCHVVPILARGRGHETVEFALATLREMGSHAAKGFNQPEGVIAFHSQSQQYFKVLLENDDVPKSLVN